MRSAGANVVSRMGTRAGGLIEQIFKEEAVRLLQTERETQAAADRQEILGSASARSETLGHQNCVRRICFPVQHEALSALRRLYPPTPRS